MVNKERKLKKLVRFHNNLLYICEDNKEKCLGKINTKIGGLTRVEKLQAVSAEGKWIEI